MAVTVGARKPWRHFFASPHLSRRGGERR